MRLISICNAADTSLLAMNSAEPIIPTYSAIALRFVEPLRHGSGLRLLTNPALLGRPEAPVVFANMIQLAGIYYISGPAFPADGEQLMRATVVAGPAAVQAHNNRQPGGQRIYTASSAADALTLVWGLVVAHYGIKDASDQVQRYELRQATDRHQDEEDKRAALELAQLGTKLEAAQHKVDVSQRNLDDARRYARSNGKEARIGFPYANQQAERDAYCANAKQQVARAILNLTAAEQALAALLSDQSPAVGGLVGDPSKDWIPDYPEAGDVADEHRDDEPADDSNQETFHDDYPGDVEQEAIGDLHNSQWE
jgi:hypothetical protein